MVYYELAAEPTTGSAGVDQGNGAEQPKQSGSSTQRCLSRGDLRDYQREVIFVSPTTLRMLDYHFLC